MSDWRHSKWLWLMLRSDAKPGGAPAGVLGMLVHMATELQVFGIVLPCLKHCWHASVLRSA